MEKKTTLLPRIGIIGGSFDPVHNGHLAIAKYFGELLNLSELVFMLAGQPWQKINSNNIPSPTPIRVQLLNLALKNFFITGTNVRIGQDEINRPGPTYTVETLKNYRNKLGNDVFLTLLIGADQFYALPSWYKWEELFDLTNVCVASRPMQSLKEFPKAIKKKIIQRYAKLEDLFSSSSGKIYFSKDLDYNISSSHIRSILKTRSKNSLENHKKNNFHHNNESEYLDLLQIDQNHTTSDDPKSIQPSLTEWSYLQQSIPPAVLSYILQKNIYK